ncbi:MAG: hypothetical protein IJU03_07020 [Thermoguttaceae bacterium]|nr:hypothetical protein [Thermoguttaceae bacterium]
MNSTQFWRLARRSAIVALALLAIVICVEPSWADDFKELANSANKDGWRRGIGMEICPIKLSILLIVYLAWVATSSWCNNDAERLGDPDRAKWNMTNLFVFLPVSFGALFIPTFWAALPVIILAWLIPIFIYVHARNREMHDADKVMTPGHLAFWFRTKVLRQKVKPKKMSYESGSLIQLEAYGDGLSPRDVLARTVTARNHNGSFGYNFYRELLYHALHARASDVRILFGAQETKFQYQIDGVYQPVEDAFRKPWTREEADDVAQVVKMLIGGNPQDRRGRCSGSMMIRYDRNKKGKPLTCEAKVETAGTPTGEVVQVTFLFKTAKFNTLQELGVAVERQDQMRSIINAESGLVVLATAPHQGLKTLTTVIFNTADRFTRDFSGVEDEQKPYEVIENIAITKYDSAKGQTPMDVLPDVFFREPKVLLIRDMVNTDAWKLCCEEVKNDRLIITTVRGNDTISAIIGILKFGADPTLLADALTSVITQRLVRRLCNTCKEEVMAPPQIVKELELDPSNPKIFRQRVHEPVEPGQKDYYVPCEDCRDIGYFGRIAVFDVLEINDEMRQVIAMPDVPLEKKEIGLRNIARKMGHKGYWVDGKRLVKFGVTSIEEIQRSLK